MKRKSLTIGTLKWTIIVASLAMALMVLAQAAFDLTSSNSALYVLRGKTGGIELSRDLILEDADRLVFMLDAGEIFHYLMRGTAQARKKPVIELTWSERDGRGVLKEYIPGGKIRSVAFSRFDSEIDKPQGLFMGGELPYGDGQRSENQNSSGFGYFDGRGWNHIWCTSNEALVLRESEETILPPHWRFQGSRVLKNTEAEVIMESSHETAAEGGRLLMRRLVSMKAGDGYYILKVRLTNDGPEPLAYYYSWGDEPWVGGYGSSEGDIGWYEGGRIKTEQVIQPARYSYAGFWDKGNDLAGEGRDYTGYANFVEWHTMPSYVFFSNHPERCCEETMPLSSRENRVMGIVWDGHLLAGESKEYVLAIGMADTSSGEPRKPAVRFSE